MESSSTCPDNLPSNRIKAIQELTQGKHLTIKLRELLEQPEKLESDRKSVDGVVAQILGMFENTLSALNSSSIETSRIPTTGDMRSPRSWDDQKSDDSSESVKTSITPRKTKRGCYKRRNSSSTCTKVTSTLIDDGYAWRKYGQKAILDAKHQRNYFRCTHRFDQGCQATKQVQKTNDDPPKYKTTYNGHHTCKNLQKVPKIILNSPNPRDNSILINFGTNTSTENTRAGPCFNSITQTPKDGLHSKVLKHEQDSSCDYYAPWDPIMGLSQVISDPMSIMSSELDHEDMISSGVFSSTSSTNGYEMDDMLGSNDFGDFPFELC